MSGEILDEGSYYKVTDNPKLYTTIGDFDVDVILKRKDGERPSKTSVSHRIVVYIPQSERHDLLLVKNLNSPGYIHELLSRKAQEQLWQAEEEVQRRGPIAVPVVVAVNAPQKLSIHDLIPN